MAQSPCKTVWQFFKELKIYLWYDLAIPPQSIYLREIIGTKVGGERKPKKVTLNHREQIVTREEVGKWMGEVGEGG